MKSRLSSNSITDGRNEGKKGILGREKAKDIYILVLWLQSWEINKNSEGKLKNMDI